MSAQTIYPKYNILGVEVDALTRQQACEYIVSLASGAENPACYVVKPYVEFLDRAARDEVIARTLNQAELCLPDGVALAWASDYLYGAKPNIWLSLAGLVLKPSHTYTSLPERFGGVDFTLPLIEAAAQKGLKVFLVGSPKHQTIQQAATKMQDRFSKLDIVGTFPGLITPETQDELLQKLRDTKPDIILVGLGFPLQETLMAKLQHSLDHGVMVGEGGSFDFKELGGQHRRAPQAIRRFHLEWLWRLMLEPKRLKRQLAIPRFIFKVWRARKVITT